jgi:two-component system NtrC family sensor kinase
LGQERRRHARHPVVAPVHVTSGATAGDGILHDLSEGGASVGVPLDIHLGAEVRIVVEGLGEVQGKVVRRKERLGVAFQPGDANSDTFAEKVLRLVEVLSEKRLVMVVEDSPTQAITLQAMLEEVGHRVICLPTAEAALEVLTSVLPDLIIVDYHLPGIQGDEFCRRLRLTFATQSLPLLMLTADRDEEMELRGLESGATDYLRKGVDPDLLRLRVQTLLREPREEREELELGEISFRRPRILVVDDSPTWLEGMAAELRRDGEFEVETASTGIDGLEKIRIGVFDCVLTDMIMTDIGGAELSQQVAAMRGGNPYSPTIIVLSAQETKENAALALEAGANDFIGKSTSIKVIRARVRAALRQAFLLEQHRSIINGLRRQADDLERMVAERTRTLSREIEERRQVEDDLRRAKDLADAANRAKSAFLANMSHELRTPLTAIIGFAEMIQTGAGGASIGLPAKKRDEYIDHILYSSRHLLEVINDVLDLARIEGGKVTLTEDPIEVSDLLNRAWKFVRAKAESQGLAFEAILPSNRITLRVDARLLTQALLNLLANAVKFTPPGGRVTVVVTAPPGQDVTIAVADTGIGIPEDRLETVLQPFGQVEPATARNFQGTGLGLTIAKSFVELHDGKLTLSSIEGQGTTVTIVLPPDRLVG